MSKRRHLLQALGATAAAGLLPPWASLALAASPSNTSHGNRLVFVILRGGLDGLTAVPALGDPAFAEARGALGVFAAEPLKLDDTFALNPLLPQLHSLYGQGELAVLHAVGLPYQIGRAHV